MQDIQDKVEELSGHVIDYMQTMYKLGKVKLTEKVANSAALAISGFIIIFFILLMLLIGGIGVAWWIGERMNNMPAGFMLVAAFYLLFAGVLFLFRKKFIYPAIRNRIVKKIYE